MKDVRDLLKKGVLTYARCDGCMVGYKDADGVPHWKPTAFVTTMDVLIDRLDNLLCSRDHHHAHLEGSAVTRDASPWPEELDDIIHSSICQQALVDLMKETESLQALAATGEKEEEESKEGRCRACVRPAGAAGGSPVRPAADGGAPLLALALPACGAP